MKTKFKLPLIVFATTLTIYACKDFTEPDLSKKYVTIVAPSDNTASPRFTQRFVWEELKGADRYQLQIVSPGFDMVQQFILDTTISATQFSFTLQPGKYEWRLKAKNGSSMTVWDARTLKIDSTLNLASSKVNLTSPEDNYNTNTLANTFTWQTMPTATSYVFQILSSGSVIETKTLTTTTATYTFTASGTYQWRVFAQNDYSNSAYASHTISLDNTAPVAPTLTAPVANSSSKSPALLSWTRDASASMDSVFIYSDSTLTQIVKDTLTANQTYNFITSALNKNYFWRVRSKDAAGNWGPYAIRRKFTIIP
jgi:hypothetical protein